MVANYESVPPVAKTAIASGGTTHDVCFGDGGAGETEREGGGAVPASSRPLYREGGRKVVVPHPPGSARGVGAGSENTVDELHRAVRFLIHGKYPDGEDKGRQIPLKVHVQGGGTYRILAVNVRNFSDSSYMVELLVSDEKNSKPTDVYNAILDMFNIVEPGDGEEEGSDCPL